MEISGVGSAVVRGSRLRLRLSSLLIAFAMLAGSLLLIQQRADAAPAGGAPVAAIAAPTLDGAAQINIDNFIQAIVCPILFAVREAFDDGFLTGIITPILDRILAAFGCTASG